MRFDITQFQGRYAMHCKTREDAQTFLEFLHKNGRSWCNGESYRSLYYAKHRDQTAYAFNEGKYGSVDWYASRGYTVLSLEDFEWDDDVTPPSNRDLQRFDNFFSQFTIN